MPWLKLPEHFPAHRPARPGRKECDDFKAVVDVLVWLAERSLEEAQRRKDTMRERVGVMARLDHAILAFELSTILALQFLVIVMIFASTAVLFVLSYQSLRSQVAHISTVEDLLFIVQRSIAGILTVVLGLEVLETLKAYFRDHHVRLEVIIVVAIIAASRHLVQVDFEHASPLSLLGISAVIVSLTGGYFLVKKALHAFPSKLSDSDPQN